MITLGQAARTLGVAKATISKAIRTGKLSAGRNEDGSFAIDPSELARYLEVNGHRFPAANGAPEQPVTPDTSADEHANTLVAELRSVIADLRADRDRTVADRDRTISDLREDRDHWRSQAERLALPKPEPPARLSWWRRLRTTG